MRYMLNDVTDYGTTQRHIIIDNGDSRFTSFPAAVDNPAYVGFLTATGLTDADIETGELNVWKPIPTLPEVTA